MSLDSLDRAMIHEAIMAVNGYDFKKSYSTLLSLEESMGKNRPFPQVSSFFGSMAMEYEDAWRNVRSAYSKLKGKIFSIPSESVDPGLLEGPFPIPFIYGIGKKELMEERGVTILGPFLPSESAKDKTMELVLSMSGLGGTLFSSLEPGLPLFSVSTMLRMKGQVVAVLYTFPLRAESRESLPYMKGILEGEGLIISPIGLTVKPSRWHQALRNRLLAAISKIVIIMEEKDGGPSWKVFDEAENSIRFISRHLSEEETLVYPRKRLMLGSRIYRGVSDVKVLLGSKERKARFTDLTPDLF